MGKDLNGKELGVGLLGLPEVQGYFQQHISMDRQSLEKMPK